MTMTMTIYIYIHTHTHIYIYIHTYIYIYIYICMPQGDPLSPMLFSLLTSVICFIPRHYGVDISLYSDDTLVQLLRPGTFLEANLQSLLAEFATFGEYTALCLNLEKTCLLLQGLDRERLAGVKVATHVCYLGAQVVHVSPAVAYEACGIV